MDNFFPETISIFGCESCKGVGTNPAMLHGDGCQAVADWHRWFLEHLDRSPDDENPVKVPMWEQTYVRVDDEDVQP